MSLLSLCRHSGLVSAHIKPKETLDSPQALCEQPSMGQPIRAQSNFCTIGPMRVLCRQPCNATRRMQATMTGHYLATQLNWDGSNQKRPFQNLLFFTKDLSYSSWKVRIVKQMYCFRSGVPNPVPVDQGYSNLALEIHFPAEFSSN